MKRLLFVVSAILLMTAAPTFAGTKLKISRLINPGSGTHVDDPACIEAWVEVFAPGGPGGSVTAAGVILYGTPGGDASLNNIVAHAGGPGGITGDQGAGGTTNGLATEYQDGRSGGAPKKDGTGGIGGGGVGDAWQIDGLPAPNQSSFGGAGAAGTANGLGGYHLGASGGGEGAWFRQPMVCGSHPYSLGAPGVVANPGAGGYFGGTGGGGRIVFYERIPI